MAKESLVLCDTNIIIEFYKENSPVLTKLRSIGQENIAVSIVTAGELLFGALNKKELRQVKRDLAHLHLLPGSECLPDPTAPEYGLPVEQQKFLIID